MEEIRRVEQVLYEYAKAGLVDQDPKKVLSFMADNVIGIGLGEQGFVYSKKSVEQIMQNTIKKENDVAYELAFENVMVNMTSETSAHICAAIYIKKHYKQRITTSGVLQSLNLVLQNGEWLVCGLHASPMMLTEESIESYPLTFADNTLAQLRSELWEEALQLANQTLTGGIFGTYCENYTYPLYFANDSMLQMLGYERDEFYAKFRADMTIIIHPDDKERILSEVKTAIDQGSEYIIKFRMLKKDGSFLWVLQHSKKSVTNEGKDVILGAITEITGMVEMQEALLEKTNLLEQQAQELETQNQELLRQREELEEQAKALTISEERFRLALEKTSNIIFDYDLISGNIMHSSTPKKTMDFVTNIREAKDSLIIGGTIMDEYLDEFYNAFEEIKKGRRHIDCIVKVQLATKKEVWNKITLTGITDQNGHTLRAVGLIEDITRQKEAEIAFKREEQYRQAILADAMGVFVANFTKGVFESCQTIDKRCTNAEVGESYDAYILKIANNRIPEYDRQRFLDTFTRANVLAAFEEGKQEIKLEYNIFNDDDSNVWVESIIRLVIDNVTNEKKGFIYIMDIDERKRKELSLTHQSESDQLTNLYNKIASEKYIRERLIIKKDTTIGAFMMIDIDHFKDINDTFGHPYGDQFLKEVAKVLQSSFRKGDILGRLGGDEFCVYFVAASKEHISEAAVRLCEKIQKIQTPENQIKVSCSIGIATCQSYPKSFETIYKEADSALYSVKKNGRNGFAFFGQQRYQKTASWVQNSEQLLNEMKLAIFICDVENYNILYMNDYLLRFLNLDRRDCYGKKCYQVICKKDSPCTYCRINQLDNTDYYERTFRVPGSEMCLLLRGQLIDWNGRTAHLEIASDFTKLLEEL